MLRPRSMSPRSTFVVLAGAVALLSACGGSGVANGRISFCRFDHALGDFRVWTADASGSDDRSLAPQISWMSDWSPDGRRIVFEDMTSLKTIDADGRNARVLLDELGFQAVPKWSPTGEWIAFEGSEAKPADPIEIPPAFERSVWVVRPDGRDLRRVTHEYDVEPVFSPDGSELAFGHVTEPGPPESAVQSVVVVGLDGTGRREIVPPTIGLQHVDWSPDGEWITFNTEPIADVVDQPDQRGSVFAVHPDGADLHVLAPATDEWLFVKPVWSPDGKQILASCNTPGGGVERLCAIDVASGDVKVVVDLSNVPIDVNCPAWGSRT